MSWIKKADKRVDYLELIGSLSPVANPVLLRHDVDYDIDHALALAEYECQNGIRATYCVLHTAKYWENTDELKDKLKKLVDFGHEIGFHNDLITVFFQQCFDHPQGFWEELILSELDFLRSIYPELCITSCHGHQSHYEKRYLNYQIWEEFDIEKNEGFMPINWFQESLEDYGLMEAYFMPYTHYYSDSGGNDIGYIVKGQKPFEHTALFSKDNIGRRVIDEYNNTPDAIMQMLIHPIHWKET